MEIINCENLMVIEAMRTRGDKFDIVELDGPYMAAIEDWDNLTESEYIEHYATRLTALRDILHPWGVVFVFGYPEGCAEIKSWCHRTNTFRCLRWITWYKQWTMHSARKTETILVLGGGGKIKSGEVNRIILEFRGAIRRGREKMGITIKDAYLATGHDKSLAHKAGGWLWYENDNARIPTYQEYGRLKTFFGLDDRFDTIPSMATVSIPGITNIDYLVVPTGNSHGINNDATLRAKSPELYIALFRALKTTGEQKSLILYGGSGNAGVAAEALGYNVVIVEKDHDRCELIRQREGDIEKWRARIRDSQLPLPHSGGEQLELVEL